MRRFNPEKELEKIQHRDRNKVIIGVVALLIIIGISSSYALYQVRYSKRIIYTKVAPFSNKDIELAIYLDNVPSSSNEFPEKNSGYRYDKIMCDNGSTAKFDNTKWKVILETGTKDSCDIYFVKENEGIPNAPELYQGMIPVYFKEGNIYIADPDSNDWYNYDEHEWGNAVLINYTDEATKAKFYTGDQLRVDTQVQEEDILQMYVWIPRYRYKLFNAEGQTGVEKQIIEIEFEKGTETTGNVSCTYTDMKDGTVKEDCKNAVNGNWYTHPAFTFKGTTEPSGTELKGIWVGKFEPSDSEDETGRVQNQINEVTILPNKTSIVNKNISTMFNAERNIEKVGNKYNLNPNEIDTHMMKNMEWGAVAYLAQSVYGIYKDENTCNIAGMTKDNCEVWINNTAQGAETTGVTYASGGTATGCVGTSVSDAVQWNKDDGSPAVCPEGRKWNQSGVKASTTGNLYGIYDTNGGAWEWVMGNMVDASGTFYSGSAGFNTTPDSKYYDVYEYDQSNSLTHKRGHLGDATRETLKTFENGNGGWYDDYSGLPYGTNPWFSRSSCFWHGNHAGTFTFSAGSGEQGEGTSFRVALTVQDGNT